MGYFGGSYYTSSQRKETSDPSHELAEALGREVKDKWGEGEGFGTEGRDQTCAYGSSQYTAGHVI
jgi:hypothetical protein